MIKKLRVVFTLALCALLLLGACTTTVGGRGVGLVRGNGNVVAREFTLDVPDFAPPEQGERWDTLHFSVLDLNMHHRNFGNNRSNVLIFDESLGNTVVITTDENLHDEFNVTAEGSRFRLSGRGARMVPTQLTIETGLPFTHLDINGAWNITYRHTGVPHADIRIAGAANGDFAFGQLQSDLRIQVDGAGSITLQGKGPRLRIELNGAGSLRAFDFIADAADVTTNGAGSAEVHAVHRLDADINGVGNITYDGNPGEGRRNVSGIGRIRAR
jgi:hypothetical protein